MVTVFTPTFNRAYRLADLYHSLISQTNSDFEWVIVDDCSTDETEELVKSWIREDRIKIVYYKQPENGGKHRAINRGVKLSSGELFFIVDSDDFLTEDAIETILNEWLSCENKECYAGLCFRRMTKDLSVSENTNQKFKLLGDKFPDYRCSATSIDIAYKWNCVADKAEVFKTDVLRNNPFPEIKGENFCEEAIVWFRIAKKPNSLLLCVDKGIYVCEYLQDGLSANLGKKMLQSPLSSALYFFTLAGIKYEWKNGKGFFLLKNVLYFVYCSIFKKVK